MGVIGATLLTIYYILIKVVSEVLLIAMDPTASYSPSNGLVPGGHHKLFLAFSFAIPLIPLILYRRLVHGPGSLRIAFWNDPENSPYRESKSIWKRPSTLIAILILMPVAIQVVGTAIEAVTSTYFPCDDYFRMLWEMVRPRNTWSDTIGAYATIGLAAPLGEEIFFRGFLLNGMIRKYGTDSNSNSLLSQNRFHLLVIYQGFLFGIIHLNPQQIFYAFPTGILLGYVKLWTNRLEAGFIVHALNNIIAVVLLYHFTDPVNLRDEVCMGVNAISWPVVIGGIFLLVVSLASLRGNAKRVTG